MDSAKTMLPHWVRIPKTVKPNMLLKYHLICVKYDGYRPDDIYYYTNTIPHDSSTTCTLIWITIMKSAPIGTPEIRAGRPLLYALCDKKKLDALKVQRYLDDFKKVRSYITDLAVQWHFSLVECESWKNLLDDVDEMQTAPSAAFSGFWPQRKEEVDDFLREQGQTAPAEARHTMAPNVDLNNAEAARVEAEVRAQVLQDDSAFQELHAGAKERLHHNTSPSDAKGTNLGVIDVSDTKGGKKPVDTSWEKCLALPWKLLEAVPLSYAKAIHVASGSREVFNEDGTMVRKKCLHPNTGTMMPGPEWQILSYHAPGMAAFLHEVEHEDEARRRKHETARTMAAAKEMRHWNPEAHIGDDEYILADVKAAVAEPTAGKTEKQEMRRVERINREGWDYPHLRIGGR
eukprot:jgi/Tetstr1/435937/TSEL_024819.t1